MTTIPQYAKILRDTMWDIAMRLGVDMSQEEKAVRAGLIATLTAQSVLIKALVDKGVITDQELLAAVNAVRSSAWQPGHLPVRPDFWDTAPVTGVPASGAPVTGLTGVIT